MNLFNVEEDMNYLLLTMGKPILVNGISTNAIIGYSKNKDIEEKTFTTKGILKRGDLIVSNSHNYIVTNEINGQRQNTCYKAYAQSCNYSIKFKVNSTIQEIPSIITSKIFDIETNQYLTLSNNKIQVTIGSTDIIFTEQMRFIKLGKVWEINGIDLTKKGLIILNCSSCSSIPDDDLINEIAFNKVEIKSNTLTVPVIPVIDTTKIIIEIIGLDTIVKDKTRSYKATVKQGINILSENVTWNLADEDINKVIIISQDGNTATLKALAASGAITLTAKLISDNTVKCNKKITLKTLF